MFGVCRGTLGGAPEVAGRLPGFADRNAGVTLAAPGEVAGLSLSEGRVRTGRVARLSYVRLPRATNRRP
ncbi:hypothetical protein GCM10010347_09290 [Streptomyces cirratus]|uniref:Uncharacterized protein n=1 Tax=Streptomyces cirratus TaxID=68187 RepID=A0ABQ3EMC6_9ACTN|nr:hypothetical protein GCM10010347_09290 [Streptomyces cirratus]